MDKEVQLYRDLVKTPDKFEDGFGWQTVIGAIFIALIITPGSLYISLVAGQGVGPAARWVTVILFAEIAKRSLKDLTKQQSFIIFYMTSHVLIETAMQTGLLWNLYLTQSSITSALGIAQQIPEWIMPPSVAQGANVTTFMTKDFLYPILFIGGNMLLQRVNHFGLGYLFYRITSDVEKLPFPMAPVAASGMLALAETRDKSQRWRQICFSIGGIVGLLFGAIYLLIPTVTSAIFNQPVYILPLPWIELTQSVSKFLPATAFNLVPSLAFVLIGMVLPFWAVVGGFLGLITTLILNPILYQNGVLHSWRPGMLTVDTLFANSIDFYFSFGLGITFFIAAIGLANAFVPLIKGIYNTLNSKNNFLASGKASENWKLLVEGKSHRGDISIWISLAIYILSTIAYIFISALLIDGFPLFFFVLYGFVYTPLVSYAAAKVEGLVGESLTLPMVKEASFILSGYKGVAIWFAPIPLHNYGVAASGFKVMELTGTKVKSLIKTDLFCFPIIITSLVFFSSVIISQGPLDSDLYPYVQLVWDLQAKNEAVIISSTLEGKRSIFFEAVKPDVIGMGFLSSAFLYGVLSFFSMPILLIYGLVRGLGQTNPLGILPEFMGALLGRFYFQKKFGKEWMKYTPAIFAGFTCGMGLMGMLGVAFRLLASSISPVNY